MTFPTLTPPPTAPDRNDPSTFVSRADAFVAWWATNNTEMASWTTLANALTGVTSTFQFSDGSAATPAVSFASDPDCGMWRQSANNISFGTNGLESFRITNVQSLVMKSATGVLGYGIGSGSAVSQATSRTTGVTSNTPAGSITMFSAAGSATWSSFVVTCSAVGLTDTVVIAQRGGTNTYLFSVKVASGSFTVSFATTGGTATDAPIVSYSIIASSGS